MLVNSPRPSKIARKYETSQNYFYSRIIGHIVGEKPCRTTSTFEDLQYLVDDQQYMRRFYTSFEYKNKLSGFKEYYFYHEDRPRIFIQVIDQIYGKWQDRRRNLAYNKIKHLLNQEQSGSESSSDMDKPSKTDHLLYQLSDYNPSSQKYYLRKQQVRSKQTGKNKQDRAQNQSKNQISELQHQLSLMLQDLRQLSAISTLDSSRRKVKPKIYHRLSTAATETASYEISQSSLQADSKLAFIKKKQGDNSTQAMRQSKRSVQQSPAKQSLDSKATPLGQAIPNIVERAHKNTQQHLVPLQRGKSKTIFSLSTTPGQGLQPNKLKFGPQGSPQPASPNIIEQKIVHEHFSEQKAKHRQGGLKLPNKQVQPNERVLRASSIDKLKLVNLRRAEGLGGNSRQGSLGHLKGRSGFIADQKLQVLGRRNQFKITELNYQTADSKHKPDRLKLVQPINKRGRLEIRL